MLIRDAAPADGVALLQTMKDCPLGSDLVITLTNEPDFFNRARIYEQARVFLAEDSGQIAGSAACAIRTVQIGGHLVRAGYEFQYIVSPAFQRRGVASRLRTEIERDLIDRGAELTTAVIISSDRPSVRLFEQQGFACERELSIAMLETTVHTDIHAFHHVRQAQPSDLPQIAHLCNATWADSNYAENLSASELAAAIERTPGCDLDTVFVLEEAGEIVATAGFWRWRDVQQINVTTVTEAAAARLPGIRIGESWRQWGLTPVGFRRPDDFTRLLGPLRNLAYSSGIHQLGVVVDPDHPIADAVQNLPHFNVAVGLFVKPLTEDVSVPPQPSYINITDI